MHKKFLIFAVGTSLLAGMCCQADDSEIKDEDYRHTQKETEKRMTEKGKQTLVYYISSKYGDKEEAEALLKEVMEKTMKEEDGKLVKRYNNKVIETFNLKLKERVKDHVTQEVKTIAQEEYPELLDEMSLDDLVQKLVYPGGKLNWIWKSIAGDRSKYAHLTGEPLKKTIRKEFENLKAALQKAEEEKQALIDAEKEQEKDDDFSQEEKDPSSLTDSPDKKSDDDNDHGSEDSEEESGDNEEE